MLYHVCCSLRQAPAPSTTCSATLSAELTEGPYYLDDILFREDITESEPGIPVTLNVYLLDTDCNPVTDAFLSIWHANASGIYSGFTGELLVLMHRVIASLLVGLCLPVGW